MPAAYRAVRAVPTMGMGYGDPLHKLRQIVIFLRPENQMPVVAHDAIAAKPHLEPFDPFGEDVFKRFKILPLLKDPKPSIRTVQDMIGKIPFRNSYRSRHNRRFYRFPLLRVNQKRCLTPLFLFYHITISASGHGLIDFKVYGFTKEHDVSVAKAEIGSARVLASKGTVWRYRYAT